MALEFKLPGDVVHHMSMLNAPMFGAAQPQTFLDLMLAQQADAVTGKPDPEKMKAFKASPPDNRAQADYHAAHNPPVSYANSSF
jgi:catalase